jgi:cytochrome c-type biogenesis protein CcmH/NrfG/ribosomal protein L37E
MVRGRERRGMGPVPNMQRTMSHSDVNRCHDCGRENPADATECAQCGFPLREHAGESDTKPAASKASGTISAGPGRPPTVPRDASVRRPRRRPTRANPVDQTSMQLWLIFGVVAAAVLIYFAVKSNVDRVSAPVEGSNPAQQILADSLLHELSHDSTDVATRVALADLLFDTGNWSDAIVHYRSAIAKDSSRTHAIVDLGVCYYNLGDPQQAERCFELALVRDPNQPIALFNMGIVYERRQDFRRALSYFHRALQAGPPDGMAQPLVEAIKRVQEQLGATAPPIGK